MSHWNLFSNHGHVLLFLSLNPDARLRDVAAAVGITERAVQKIVRDMQDSGVVTVTKHGRRNQYEIDRNEPLRHDLESHCTIGQVVELIETNPRSNPVAQTEQASTEPVTISEPPSLPDPEVAAPLLAEPQFVPPVPEPEPESLPDAVAEPEARAEPVQAEEKPVKAVKKKKKKVSKSGRDSAADNGEQGSLF